MRQLKTREISLELGGLTPEQISAVDAYSDRLVEAKMPILLSTAHFARTIGVDDRYIFSVVNEPEKFYRTFSIRKSSGKSREISEPLPLLKIIQRWILDNILVNAETHASVKSYKSGSSVKTNARFHTRQELVVKYDLEDFFGRISTFSVFRVFFSFGYSKSVSASLARLCTLKNKLPQGAPTSGSLSNIFLRRFDASLFEHARISNLRYTRYSDDITFSGRRIDFGNIDSLTSVVSGSARDFEQRLNYRKLRILGKHNRQAVTGIVVNEKMDVARNVRKSIRQEIYYIRRYGVQGHIERSGKESPLQCLDRLIGMLAHVSFVRPDDLFAAKAKADLVAIRHETLHLKSAFSPIERKAPFGTSTVSNVGKQY